MNEEKNLYHSYHSTQRCHLRGISNEDVKIAQKFGVKIDLEDNLTAYYMDRVSVKNALESGLDKKSAYRASNVYIILSDRGYLVTAYHTKTVRTPSSKGVNSKLLRGRNIGPRTNNGKWHGVYKRKNSKIN